MLSHIKNLALGVVLAACFLVLDAHAQEVQIGTGILCDTKAQAEQFVALNDELGDNNVALQQVNDEAKQANACAVATVAYIVVEEVGKVQSKDGLLSIVLDKWCKNSNGQCVQFINQSSRDVPIDSEAEFNGTFRQCLGDLMTSIGQQVGRRFRWHLTSNNVLILTDDTIKD